MKRNKIAFAGLALLGASSIVLAGCASGGGDTDSSETPNEGSSAAVITTNGSEPQNPLIPTNTTETGGGKIVDSLFAGLVTYKADGSVENDVAEDITVDSPTQITVKLREGLTFTDGTPVQAHNFIDAWNYGADPENAHGGSYFFSEIEGFGEGAELSGLAEVDDYTFTITLNTPATDFAQRLGYSAFYPLPDAAFEDIEAFGQNPIGNGPYKLDGDAAWEHDVKISLVTNEDYDGPREPANGGLEISFYASQDAAYAALLGGDLDVLDAIPDSAFGNYETDLDGRSVNQPAAIFQSLTIPQYLEHFQGEEGQLRRQALSLAINRDEITEVIFQGTRTPATDFTSPVIDGWTDELEGADVLGYDPERAKELWAEADEISPYEGTFTISYNADGGHQTWVDAVANSIKNTLGIEAEGNAYPDFASLLEDEDNDAMTGSFRSGWQADYPGLYNFLGPLYQTGAGSNYGRYSSDEFDSLIKEGISEADQETATGLFLDAQEVLLQDLPVLPLWYSNVVGGYSAAVDNVEFGWNSVPLYEEITKAE
ncbi:peptide ABC transporter substrate-binding protein [Microbacterium marinilacus]|uniref:ABC transporter substrate-binding protein n=1 Tax=Microbacterium marinilacus TaxID=415209 RepID=A0ABP7B6L4_9MICO|nr:ABC transporter substrate-binding protein [Microbacterium marinilacus]MBY0687486.1 ABC transporter substrate-binding protein [Microbacterium marinilacus]